METTTASSSPVHPRAFDPARRAVVVAVAAAVGLTLLLALLLARVVQLQLRPGEQLTRQMSDRVTSVSDMAERGLIVDRVGRPAAVTTFGFRAVVDPTILKREELDSNIVRLARAMDVEPESIGEKVLCTIARNDEILKNFPPEQPKPSGLRALLIGLFSPNSQAVEPESDEDQPDASTSRKPTRFLVLGGVLTDEQVAKVRALAIVGVALDPLAVREYPSGTIASSIVGLVGAEPRWGVGVERRLNSELEGEDGSVSYTRDGRGRPLWMEHGQVEIAKPGEDVQLSIDIEMQRIAYEELMRGVEDADSAGGRCVVMDPLTGEVLAMVDIARDLPGLTPFPWPDKPKRTPEEATASAAYDAWRAEYLHTDATKRSEQGLELQSIKGHPRYVTMREDAARRKNPAMGRNRCVEDVYEPGSTFKSFVWSVITELGVMKPDDVVDTENGKWNTPFGRIVRDVHPAASLSWSDVLVNSSNIGMIKGSLRLTSAQMHDICERFGFGRKTGIELPGEASGIVTPLKHWSVFSQSSVAHGYEIAVTPIQMVRAFCAFSRPGELAGTLPEVHLKAVVPDEGARAAAKDFQRGVIYRVLPPGVAVLTREVMAKVAEAAESKMKDTPVGGWRYTMFGKSGTAQIPLSSPPGGKMKPKKQAYYEDQYNSSFIAAGPTEEPRLVVLVVIDDPGPKAISIRHHYGSYVAAPVVRRVMERSLTYLGTAPSPPKALQTAAANERPGQ